MFTSLRSRLILLSALTIATALLTITYALNNRFNQYFEGRIYSELETHLEQLATSIIIDRSGNISVASLPDRRFDQPFSGLYWQVLVTGRETRLSRSLWGKTLDTPQAVAPGGRFRVGAVSPTGSPLLVSGWGIVLGEGELQQNLVLSIATDQAEVRAAAEGFRAFLMMSMGGMMLALMLASTVQISVGLAPLKLIHRKVEEVQKGLTTRLEGRFPTEVQPLVDEVNILLAAHEASLASARSKAADLAHGLKTPLTVMRALLHDVGKDLGPEKAAEIEAQITSMHSFIERELVQARKNTTGLRATFVGAVTDKMVASFKKLPRSSALTWKVDIPEQLVIPYDEHDLSELLGNLLDNARKWAKSEVHICGGTVDESGGWLTIEDDGEGVPEAMLGALVARGQGMEDNLSETGLGLAICHDLISAIGGELVLGHSKLGGFKATLNW